MSRHLRMLTTLGTLLVAISASQAGFAQKPGGVLRVHALDSPPELVDARKSCNRCPKGCGGTPPEVLKTLPGYAPRCSEKPCRARTDHEEA